MIALGFLFHPQSTNAQAIAILFARYLTLAAVIFLVVLALVVYSLIKYRARAGAVDLRQNFGSRRLEIAWTAIPLLIVTVLFIVTVRTMAFVDAPLEPRQAPDLVVTGHQWWWEAKYPNGAVTSHEIHIPAGRRLLVRLESADVIHDFWVPELARKMDAVPGTTGYLWLEAQQPGTYRGTCSEFCGVQHAWMRFLVIAETDAQFSAWLARQALPAPEAPETFRRAKCLDCHALSATDTKPRSGPPLAHIASRDFLEGDLQNTAANLRRWITNPQLVKPGNRMPDSQVSGGQVRELTEYLGNLQ
ncbi:MAG: cytochrome c oxidase subunit II [Terriglobia bacterium]|nr:MAG: cytochrome c oxidase subunit II [Terriglobia bacterium]